MHPFRFAVQVSGAPSAQAWRDLARRTEALGYSTLYIHDHFEDQWGPLVAMTVAAEATQTLRVGSLVFGNDYRHPLVLAREVATLDLVSSGRVEFGLGAGWMRSDYEASGMRYDSAGVRIERMREALQVMRALWSDGRATVHGSHYHMTDAVGAPLPASRPHPAILIGGGGRRVLSLAAREADIVGVNPNLAAGVVNAEVAQSAKGERFAERVQWVREAAGARFEELELQCLTFAVQVVPNPDEVVASLAPLFGLSPEEVQEVPIALVGTVDSIVETLERRREQYGFSYWVVHSHEMELFAPVVSRLTGT